ncbi:MAG: PAS domain-containing protein, partial [Anaerolineales bacterium]
MNASRAGTSPLLRWLPRLAGIEAERNARLQHVLEQLPSAALLVAPRSGSFLAINGKAAALTEWARDELMARSLSEVVAAPGPGEALEEFYLIEPGSVRHFYNVPLRTRSG